MLPAQAPDDGVMAYDAETRYRDIVSDGAPADQAGWDGGSVDRIADPENTAGGRRSSPALTYRGTEVVLDAGCGTGRVTEELLRPGTEREGRSPRRIGLDAGPGTPTSSVVGTESPVRSVQICWPLTRNSSTTIIRLTQFSPLQRSIGSATMTGCSANLASVLAPGGQFVRASVRRRG